VLLTIIVLDIFRDYKIKEHHKYFTLHTILIAGVAGLLPDIDVPLNWLLRFLHIESSIFTHGGLTHSVFFGLLFLIPGFILWKSKRHKSATYFFVICYGILFHLFLDSVFGGGGTDGPMLLYPLSTGIFKIGLLYMLPINDVFISLDAIILLLWLWHEEAKHKIKDYI
jgi:membrane-bound metal-dependent hydrolase YbcI (DUF457 family)